MSSATTATATVGYPRIGANRETKKALEQYWSGIISETVLHELSDNVESASLDQQAQAGISLVGVGDHTLYDHVLDWTSYLGCIPERFHAIAKPLDLYFAMARGVDGAPALDMSKFYGTNYHYLVPEISAATTPAPDFTRFLNQVAKAQKQIGANKVSPIVLGPVTFIHLANLSGVTAAEVMAGILPAYAALFAQLRTMGVPEIQVHEPCLVVEEAPSLKPLFDTAYTELAKARVPIHIATYFDDVPGDVLSWVVGLPGLAALSLDFTRGDNLASLRTLPAFPAGVRLGCGVVDGRSVWADGGNAHAILAEIRACVGPAVSLSVQPSCSLQYVPLDLDAEAAIPEELRKRLAFAKQKLNIVAQVAAGGAKDAQVRAATAQGSGGVSSIPEEMFNRKERFEQRRPLQFTVPGGFGTNTIGSFPQTPEIRKSRLQHKKGTISDEAYRAEVDKYIKNATQIQEDLGLDVFVHGEPERSDMVEFFGVHLDGMMFTTNGWVQSYGSRYVRPPIIYADVARTGPMTIREFKYAQSLTTKPVKGMLTAATTIINWSFPRIDVSREVQAYQLGLALREEVLDLEAAGCRIIQVDDPAIREGLPLKKKNWPEYLKWAVRAFRLSTSGVKPETQIYSHLCYADFEDILEAIDGMDVDVLTVENSRSGDEMLRAFVKYGYARDIGPGVYDIHSPVVPPVDVIQKRIRLFLDAGLSAERLWINPDCGLKTRKWEEVIPSLKALVTAAKEAREQVLLTQ